MKVTIEIDNVIATVEEKNAVTLDDALRLIDQVLWGVGFVYEGELSIAEEEVDLDSHD